MTLSLDKSENKDIYIHMTSVPTPPAPRREQVPDDPVESNWEGQEDVDEPEPEPEPEPWALI